MYTQPQRTRKELTAPNWLNKNVHAFKLVLTKDPAYFPPNFDPLWILAVGDGDTESQHCRYPRKSSVIAWARMLICVRHVYCCLPMNLLVARTSFPGLSQPRSQCLAWLKMFHWHKIGGFVENRLKLPRNIPHILINGILTVQEVAYKAFLKHFQGSEFGRFWAKCLAYSPWFWTWRILISVENRLTFSKKHRPHAYK